MPTVQKANLADGDTFRLVGSDVVLTKGSTEDFAPETAMVVLLTKKEPKARQVLQASRGALRLQFNDDFGWGFYFGDRVTMMAGCPLRFPSREAAVTAANNLGLAVCDDGVVSVLHG